MEDIKNNNPQEAEPEIETVFDYSIKDECERVAYTLGKNEWYKERGYKLKYPQQINQKLERNEEIKEEDILEAITAEFDQNKYAEQAALIMGEWDNIKGNFFKNLRSLSLPLQDKYFICLTKYGTGGSYGLPDNIQLNIEQKRSASLTIAHEIVHLTIEHLIKEYNIDHWTKERLVDLIMNKFFPEQPKLQRDPEKAEQIFEIFEREFPDIEKIIKEISEKGCP